MAGKGESRSKSKARIKESGEKGLFEPLMKLDATTRQLVLPHRDRPAAKLVSRLSEIGDQPQMLSLCGALCALGLVRGDRRMAEAGARMVAAHLLTTAVKNFVKARVDRSRPHAARGRDGHRPRLGRSDAKEETSFPSGHSAGALAVARAFGLHYPRHRAAALAAAGAIAAARIPRCSHYPTDVAAGLAIGAIAEAAVDKLWRRLARLSMSRAG